MIQFLSCERDQPPVSYTSISGIYTCQESSSYSGVRQYPVEIDRVRDTDNQYSISNFHNKGENEFVFAELTDDTLRIFQQAISDISVNGKGPVSDDLRTIMLEYQTDDGIIILDYFTVYKR
jgi:hypothetical protein